MCELGMQCTAKSLGCRWSSEIALRSQTLSLNSALTAVGIDDEYKGLLLGRWEFTACVYGEKPRSSQGQ